MNKGNICEGQSYPKSAVMSTCYIILPSQT